MRALIWLSLWVALVVACDEPSLRFGLHFEAAEGLKPGDNVMMRGIAVGQVLDVDLDGDGVLVKVEIKPKFKGKMDAAGRYWITSEKLVTGKKMVAVEPGEPFGRAVRQGERVTGLLNAGGALGSAKAAIQETVEHARGQAKGLGRAILHPDRSAPRGAGDTVDLERPGGFVLRLLSIRLKPTTADGKRWDLLGRPDLLIQVWAGQQQILLTDPLKDTLEHEWAALLTAPFDLAARPRVRVKVLDVDVRMSDEIGIVELEPTLEDAASGRVFRLAAGRIAELQLQVLPHAQPAPASAPIPPAPRP
ncbi:MCE family protein [Myxococcota bacterium]|nr:MCE family protein [Myxococcota bacterium]MBU1431325.1 MCE family protein [Myxococcota bacterium]MBU1897384.1 MCE family protein [Myxococcota bacterium]